MPLYPRRFETFRPKDTRPSVWIVTGPGAKPYLAYADTGESMGQSPYIEGQPSTEQLLEKLRKEITFPERESTVLAYLRHLRDELRKENHELKARISEAMEKEGLAVSLPGRPPRREPDPGL